MIIVKTHIGNYLSCLVFKWILESQVYLLKNPNVKLDKFTKRVHINRVNLPSHNSVSKLPTTISVSQSAFTLFTDSPYLTPSSVINFCFSRRCLRRLVATKESLHRAFLCSRTASRIPFQRTMPKKPRRLQLLLKLQVQLQV